MNTVDIRGRLTAEMGEAEGPPIGSLVTDAVATGRRMRRRRRFVAVTGTCVGLVLLVAGGVAAASALRPEPAAVPVGPMAPPETSATEAPPTGNTFAEAGEVLDRLTGLIPPGSEIQNPQVSAEEYGVDVVFTLVNGAAAGQVSLGVLHGDDPARFQCHTPGPDCQVGAAGAAEVVRSLHLDGGTLRVDADLPGDLIVFVEAEGDVLTREQGIAIASAAVWLD